MHAFHVLSDLGEVFIPAQFRELASDDASLRHFTNGDLGQLDRIFKHLRRGGVAVLSGRWDRIMEVLDYAERKRKELATKNREAETRPRFQPARQTRKPQRKHLRDVTPDVLCGFNGQSANRSASKSPVSA